MGEKKHICVDEVIDDFTRVLVGNDFEHEEDIAMKVTDFELLFGFEPEEGMFLIIEIDNVTIKRREEIRRKHDTFRFR